MTKKMYKTMQGKEIDLEAIRIQNEMAVAVGNGKMNARGDRLGPGGKIEKKIEEVVADYYENYPAPMADSPNTTTVESVTPKENSIKPVPLTVEVKKKV